jgi:hypothetical protein
MLNLDQVEEEVRRLARKIDAPGDALPVFGRSEDFGRPNVEVDSSGYHLVFVERGEELKRMTTPEVPVLLYWVFCEATFDMATGYEAEHRRPKSDFRRLLFETQVTLLSRIDPAWAERKQREIDLLVAKFPFKDQKTA